MANDMDTRVVQMQFENRQFERNIAKSTKSLSDFKEALNFSQVSSSLQSVFSKLNSIDLSGLIDNVGRIADKFTGLGRISEMVMSEIQSKVRNGIAAISNFADSMTTAQISAGKEKYETLNKSVQTIMAATGKGENEVYEVMKRLNQYTDQTSYNFADMAQNIGKFTSVGISLEDAEKQMEGIANWAARSGAGIQEASRAMYNLSQAMGVGKLTLIDWKSIENAGMATTEFKEQLIASGVAAGTLEKTTKKMADGTTKTIYKTAKNLGKQVEVSVQNAGSTLNKGWATSAVLSSTLNKYYWDDLYYEGSEAILKLSDDQKKAFDEMLTDDKLSSSDWQKLESMGVITENVKQKILDLAATQGKLVKETDKDGKTIYSYVDKNGKKMKVTLDNIKEALSKGWFDAEFGKALTSVNDLAKSSYEAAQKCTTFTDVLGAWKDMISTGWMTSFQHIFGNLSESMEFFSNVCNGVSDELSKLIDLRNTLLQGWAEDGGRQSLFSSILGDYGSDVETGAYGLLDVFHDIGTLISDGFWNMVKMFAPEDTQEIWDADDGQWRIAFLQNKLKEFTDNIQTFMQSIRNFFTEEVKIGDTTTTRIAMIRNVIDGLAGVFVFAYNVIHGIVTFFAKVKEQLNPSFLAIENMFSEIGKAIYEDAGAENQNKGILGFFTALAEKLTPLTSVINTAVIAFTDMITKIIQWGKENGVFEKIGSGIQKLFDIVSRVSAPIAEFVGNIFEAVGGLFEKGFTTESLKDAGKKLLSAIKHMFRGIVDALPDSLKGIKNAIYELFGLGGDGGSRNDSIFKRIHDFFTGGFEKVKALFEDGTLKGIWESIKGFFSNGLDGVESVIDKVLDWFDNLSLGDAIKGTIGGFTSVVGWLLEQLKNRNLFTLVKGVLGVMVTAKIYQLIKSAKDAMSSVADFFKNPLGTLFGGGRDDSGLSMVVDKILDVAKAIALISGAIVILGAIPTGQLVKGGLALVAVLGVVTGFIAAINAVSGSGSLKSSINYIAITTLALSVGVLVAALLPLTLVSWEGLGKMMAGLGGIMLQLVAFMKLSGSLNVQTVSLGSFIGFALSIALLVTSLLPLTLVSWEGFGKMMAGLGGVLAELIGFMLLTSYMPVGTGQLGGFIGFAASISILVFSLLPLASISWEGFGKMMAGLGGVLLQLIGFMLLTTYLPIGTAQLGGFLGFAASIALLVLTLQPLANMSWEGYAKMMAGLGGILAQLILFSLLMKNIRLDPGSMATIILFAGAISVAMLSFGIALAMVKGIDWSTIAAFALGLSAVMFSMSAAIAIVGSLPISTAVKGILALVAGIVLITGALAIMIPVLLGSIGNSIQSLAGRLRLVGELLSEFCGTMNSIGEGDIDNARTKLDEIKDLIVSLGEFQGMDKIADDFSVAMWALSSGLAVAFREFGQIGDINDLSALQLLKEIQANYTGLDTLSKLNLENLQANISGLGGAMMLYAKGVQDVAKAEGMDTNGGINETAITAAVEIMKKISETLVEDGKFEIPDMPSETALTNWGTQLAALAGALVMFEEAGAGLGEGTDKALEVLTFFQQLKQKLVETDAQANLNFVATFMGGLTLTASVGSETSDQTADVMTQFAAHIAGLGEAMRSFAEATTSVDEETGEVRPIDYTKATDALNTFMSLKEKMPSVGGVVQWITGTKKDLVDLGTEIEGLGTSLSSFSQKINGGEGGSKFNPEDVKAATGALNDMADCVLSINQKLPRLGFIAEWFMDLYISRTWSPAELGDQFGTFGEGLGKIADGLMKFSTDAKGSNGTTFDSETVKTASAVMTDIVGAIAAINEKMPRMSWVASAWNFLFGTRQWTGEELGKQFGGLGEGIGKLGTGLMSFASSTTGGDQPFDPDSVGNAIGTMDQMITFMNSIQGKLPVIGGLGAWFENFLNGHTMTMEELSTHIGQLGDGLGKLGSGLGSGGWTEAKGAEQAFQVIESLLDVALKLGQLQDMSTTMSGDPNLWLNNLTYILDSLTGVNELVTGPAAGMTPGQSIIEGLTSFMAQLDMALEDITPDTAKLESLVMVSEILNALSNMDVTQDFTVVGQMIATGTANGIIAGTSGVIDAAVDMAVAAYNAARQALDIGSPSRLFAEIGGFVAAGMANGIDDGTGLVTGASQSMSEGAVNGAASVLSNLGSLLDGSMESDPTISPILDLTNFNSGLSEMQSAMYGNSMTIDTSAAGRFAMSEIPNRSTQEINQNGSDYSGLYQRMELLSREIETLGTQIGNMKLVLDSGAVAGGITSDVDMNLGRNMFYANRNN